MFRWCPPLSLIGCLVCTPPAWLDVAAVFVPRLGGCLSQETGLYLAEGQMVLSVSGGSGVTLQEPLPLRKVRRLESFSPCGHSGWLASMKLVPVVVHSQVTQPTSLHKGHCIILSNSWKEWLIMNNNEYNNTDYNDTFTRPQEGPFNANVKF